MRGPSKRMFAVAAILAAATGCEVVEDLLGTGGGPDSADRLVLQSITLKSDHPAVAGEVQGAAVGTSGTLVRFEATGNFINIDDGDAPVDRDVTGSVLWASSDPLIANPGSDGRILLTTTGSTIISVSNPAAGDVPALESNEILLTVMTAGTGS